MTTSSIQSQSQSRYWDTVMVPDSRRSRGPGSMMSEAGSRSCPIEVEDDGDVKELVR